MTDRDGGAHDGRVAVVTGGSGAIGRAIAERLLDQGACCHTLDPLPWSGAPREGLTAHQVDVSSEEQVDAAFAAIVESAGPISYLVCCAGVFHVQPFLDLSPQEWSTTLAVNLRGMFLSCRAALRSMRPNRSGRIVLFSSMLARTGGTGVAHYAATKGGILGLARSLALEVAQEGIRVNTVSPGITDTPMPRGSLSEDVLRARAKQNPLGRIGSVEDMVEAVLFLLSDENSYMTGQDLRVAGGASLW